MSRKPIIILFVVLLLLFGFAGTAAAEEGTADADSGSSSQEKDPGGTSTGSADFGSATDSGSFNGGSLFDSGGQDIFSSDTSAASEPGSGSSDYSAPQEQAYTESAPTVAGNGAETEPSAYESDSSTEPEPDTAGSGSFSDSESGQVSGENGLPQSEPTLSTDPPAVEGNTDGSSDSSGQDACREPAIQNSDEQTQESGNTFEVGPSLIDPYFYDASGNKYQFFGATGIQAAINAFVINNGRGLIYVEAGTFNGFSANVVPNLTGIVFKDFYPSEQDNPFNPYDATSWPLITGNINITGMPSEFTLLGFKVDSYVYFHNCSGQLNLNYLEVGTPNFGIQVTNHTGNIVISNVESNNNQFTFGAYIENNAGGNVTITNSSFNNNPTYGIKIDTSGIVTAKGISASGNQNGYGMQVNGFSSLTINDSVFIGNVSGNGLEVSSDKNAGITFSNVYAANNSRHGLFLNTSGAVLINDTNTRNNNWDGLRIGGSLPGARNVTVNRGSFNNNSWDGVFINTTGAITLTDVNASQNSKNGVKLENIAGSGNITIRSSLAGKNSDYSGNAESGMVINANGVISMSDVNIAGNSYYGADIRNHFASAVRNVTISRVISESNKWGGIYILSRGNVILTDVSSFDNQHTSGTAHGLFVNNQGQASPAWTGTGSVTIRSSRAGITYDFSGNNRGSGIYILSNGAVTVSDVSSNNNLWHGIRIENHTASAARNVTITRASVNGNTAIPHSRDGIYILSKGNVLLTDVSSSDNRNTSGEYHGLYINNRGDGSTWVGTGTVTIRSSRAGITYDFSGNSRGSGIYILSNGAVAVSDVTAKYNLWHGIRIENNNAAAARNVTLTRATVRGLTSHPFSRDGIYILSGGNVLLTDVSSSSSTNTSGNYHGLYIDNTYGTGSVTVRSSRSGTTYDFSYNLRGSGIFVRSNGAVAISDVTANKNLWHGIRIENHTASAARNVTLTRASVKGFTLPLTSRDGIYILSKGNVTLTDVSSSNNQNDSLTNKYNGLYINNTYGTGSVTVLSSRAGTTYDFSGNNWGSGIYIRSNGAVAVSDVTANNNLFYGIGIENHTASAARNVTLARVSVTGNTASPWSLDGIYILSRGNVSLTDVSSSDNRHSSNPSHGLFIDNRASGAGTGSVTIRSSRAGTTYNFSGNRTGSGIWILSNGAVSISDVTANDHFWHGIRIENHTASAARSVTLNRVSVSGIFVAPYSWDGIYILSRGNVTITDVSSSWNRNTSGTYNGLYIDNRGVETAPGVWNGAGSVTVRSSRAGIAYDFYRNDGGHGIWIRSNGVVSVSDVTANENRYDGIRIENNTAPAVRNVSVTRGSFGSNKWSGINISSNGAVILTDVSASDNTNRGVTISNTAGNGNVTLSSSRAGTTYDFSNNNESGIHINSKGTVSISDVTASNNNWYGIWIFNHTAPAARNVSITRSNFEANGKTALEHDGIRITSKGTVTLTDVNSTGHLKGNGAYINNRGDGPTFEGTGNVVISSSRANTYNHYSNNSKNGILIFSNGVVSISNVNAFANDEQGASISNHQAPLPRAVNITRGNFSNNQLGGLYILSKGQVTLIDVAASNNWHATSFPGGVYIDNRASGAGTGNVTIRSSRAGTTYDFSNNRNNGIAIYSNGNISISNVSAIGNITATGIVAETFAANKNITLQDILATDNTGSGIYARLIEGTVTVRNVRSYRNGSTGIWIGSGSGRVNFVNSSFIGNNTYGINVRREPAMVSLSTTYAAGNGAQNIYIAP